MKILRSKGTSFTESLGTREGESAGKLSRGLRPRADRNLTPSQFADEDVIAPNRLADYVGQDHALALRQTISALDKVIRKPRTLRGFERQAYIDRTLLSEELWKRLCADHRDKILALDHGEEAFHQFASTWRSKVHPYARYEFDAVSPGKDGNAKLIRDFADPRSSRTDFSGRWHDAFWITGPDGQPDYGATADAIYGHLWVQERDIVGRQRRDIDGGGGVTGRGLVENRGLSMVNSAKDPRAAVKDKEPLWRLEDARLYFKQDIARRILDDVLESATRNEQYRASRFGELLFEHFGVVVPAFAQIDGAKKRLWLLHNKVRQHYQKLGRSERFRRALTEEPAEREAELRKILPENGKQLLSILGARRRNSDIGNLIRVGKLIVHATDLPSGTVDVPSAFNRRMDYLVTSDGQSEIKRNEALTRVWRNSVGLSLRTLKAWIDPASTIFDSQGHESSQDGLDTNEDFADIGVAKYLVENYDKKNYENNTQIIFGAKEIDWGPRSRSSIFVGKNERSQRKLLWGLLRIAGDLRNRTIHFNTKNRLIQFIGQGIMHDDQMSKDIKRATSELLEFDKHLLKSVIVDDLNRLDLGRFLDPCHKQALIEELSRTQGSPRIVAPRFRAIIQRQKDLKANNEALPAGEGRRLASLDLAPEAAVVRDVDQCRLGVLRLLYASGFREWLACLGSDSNIARHAVANVIAAKKQRIMRFQKEVHQFYQSAETTLEGLVVDTMGDLEGLLGRLASQAAAESRLKRVYRANPAEQRAQSTQLEKFRQELFAELFVRYLAERDLSWVWEMEDRLGLEESATPLTPADICLPEWSTEPWQCQFYAWLYLVPVDDISLLRHQLRKTVVLEGKGSAGSDPGLMSKLEEIDRLMGLYSRVQGAGFSGTEHVADPRLKELLYEDPAQFDIVYSEEMEFHDQSFPGTRRGLRQMLRFGHYEVLEGIFRKHKITKKEVAAFTGVSSLTAKEMIQRCDALRAEIISLSKQPAPHPEALASRCNEYRHAAVETALYDFRANAARLAEHARLHQLLMRVIGRLTDFTLMWERDAIYLFLGMLYRGLVDEGQFEVTAQAGSSEKVARCIGLRLPASMAEHAGTDTFLPLWQDGGGFALPPFSSIFRLLDDQYLRVFNHYFYQAAEENRKDVDAEELRRREGKKKRKSKFRDGRRKIRNDFAHYNVIGAKRGHINLNYLVNAVRSLLSHDRKLKNAVSKAVKEILADDGLVIDWQLDQDRLGKPLIMPRVANHLMMLRGPDRESLRFCLPCRSVRYTSMVKALFEFDTGGYRMPVGPADKKKRRGPLTYPEALWKEYADRIPAPMFIRYPELASEDG